MYLHALLICLFGHKNILYNNNEAQINSDVKNMPMMNKKGIIYSDKFFAHGYKGCRQKTPSIFTDIIQIEIDPPSSHPIFDKFIFDKVLIMLTSLPPLKFLTKITKF